VLYLRTEKDNELQSKLKGAVKSMDRQDEQFPNLSSSENTEIFPPLKTVVKHPSDCEY
jgi:hypothetical protein